MTTAFIIQARMGSTRLPGKLLLPFCDGRTILDIMVDKLRKVEDTDIIIATTLNPIDMPIVAKAEKMGIKCFRGSENDVLQRFVDAAQYYGAKKIIRVCSDNPFIDVNEMRRLVAAAKTNREDYISFDVDGVPSILTHYGFWAEYVSLDALLRIKELTKEPFYHEHVTNYIYKHPSEFDIKWLDVDKAILNYKDIRLTIDTSADMENASRLLHNLMKDGDSYPDIPQILQFIQEHSEYSDLMRKEIQNNQKK